MKIDVLSFNPNLLIHKEELDKYKTSPRTLTVDSRVPARVNAKLCATCGLAFLRDVCPNCRSGRTTGNLNSQSENLAEALVDSITYEAHDRKTEEPRTTNTGTALESLRFSLSLAGCMFSEKPQMDHRPQLVLAENHHH